MKSKNSFVTSLLVCASLTSAIAPLSLMSSSAFAVEAVKTKAVKTDAAGKKSEDTPTPEEVKKGAVKSPYKGCESFVMVEADAFKKNSDYWSQYPAPPTCDPAIVSCTRKVQLIPNTSFVKAFNGQPGVNLASKKSAVDFLAEVASKSIADLEKEKIPKLEKRRDCFKNGGSNCAEEISKFKSALVRDIPNFRLAIGNLLENSSKVAGTAVVTDNSKQLIDRKLSEAEKGFLVPSNMAPMTDAEFAAVEKNLNNVLAPAWKANQAATEAKIAELKLAGNKAEEERSNAKTHNLQSKAMQEALTAERTKNQEIYTKLLTANSALGYIGNANASNEEIAKGLGKMITDANDHLKDLKTALDKKDAKLDPSKMDSNLLQFAGHSRTIESIIAAENKEQKPSSCAVATAVASELTSVKTRDGALFGTGMVIASALPFGLGALAGKVLTGVVWAERIGTIVGRTVALENLAGGIGYDYLDYSEKGETARNAKVGTVTIKDGSEAVEGQQGSIVMAPLNFMGTGALWGAATGVAGGIGAKIAMSTILKDGRNGSGGAGKALADKLGKQIIAAEAGDKGAATAALKAAADKEKELFGHELSATEQSALDAVAKKNVLGDASKPNIEAIAGYKTATAGMKPDEVKAYAANVQEIAGGLKADLGNAERREAVGAALPKLASELKPADAKAILNDPQYGPEALTGLSGLTARMKSYVGDKTARFKQAWTELATKAKMTKEQIANWRGPCGCTGMCPRPGVAANESPWDMASGGHYEVCAAH